MSEISKADEGGGPAFPSTTEGVNSFGAVYPIHETGMSIRDYFAAQSITTDGTVGHKYLAERAYAIADAMLEARKVKP